MTNKEAFMAYYPDSTRAELTLVSKSIDPTLEDENEVSSAWGMMELLTSSDYSQGRTSEKLSAASRGALFERAKGIFEDNDIDYQSGNATVQDGGKW